MTAKRLVLALVVALAVYFAIIGAQGVYFIGQHPVALKVLGGAVLALPLLGIWVVAAELRFGMATQRLARRLELEAEPADPELARSASGRPDRVAADALFEVRRRAVLQQPDDWRGWYRLAVAYDLAGDRKRARAAMRNAIARAVD